VQVERERGERGERLSAVRSGIWESAGIWNLESGQTDRQTDRQIGVCMCYVGKKLS
jgi:hypothetical protein